jgi:hypothetical protein
VGIYCACTSHRASSTEFHDALTPQTRARAMLFRMERYLAFMLRLWDVGNSEDPVWRASLENPHTGERRTFASKKALFAYLDDLATGEPRPANVTDKVDAPPQSDGSSS